MKTLSYYRRDAAIDFDSEGTAFLNRNGFKLPPDYLAFLKINGTGSGPSPGHWKGECYVDKFFPFSALEIEDEYTTDYAQQDLIAMERITKNVLPIASAQGGHVIFCLVLDGPFYGYVISIDDDELILPQGYTEKDIELAPDRICGKTFAEFVDQFEPNEA